MVKSMLQPGKQHNFRVTVDATWTDAFNRLADKHKWSANKTMNILLHNALNYMDQTTETITVDLSPYELDLLLRLRNQPQESSLQPTPAPVVDTPSVERTVTRPQANPIARVAPSTPRPETNQTSEAPSTKSEDKLSPRERALAQSKLTKL